MHQNRSKTTKSNKQTRQVHTTHGMEFYSSTKSYAAQSAASRIDGRHMPLLKLQSSILYFTFLFIACHIIAMPAPNYLYIITMARRSRRYKVCLYVRKMIEQWRHGSTCPLNYLKKKKF